MASTNKNLPTWAVYWVKAHRAVFILAMAFTVMAATFLPRLELDFSPDRLFASDEPDYVYYQERVSPNFGADDKVCIIAIEGDLKAASTKEILKQLVQTLTSLPFVVETLSPLNMLLPSEGPLDLLSYESLPSLSDEQLKKAATHPLYQSFLLSEDGRRFAVYARLQPKWKKMKDQDVAVRQLIDKVEEHQKAYPHLTFSVAGVPASQERIVSTLIKEQMIFVPIVFLLLSLFLYLIFRDFRGVFIPFVVTAVAAIWCVGWMSAFEHDINIVNNSIVILIVVIGVADSMHIFSRYLEEFDAIHPADQEQYEEVVIRTVAAMAFPCLLTTSTTAIGFLAALSASMEVIRTFGFEAAIGVLGAYVATMSLMPTLLLFFQKPIFKTQLEYPPQLRAQHLLSWTLQLALRYRYPLTAIAILTTCASTYAIQDLRANQYLVDELPADDPTVHSTKLMESHFSGVLPFAIVFEGKPASLKSPAAIRAMAQLTALIESNPIGAKAFSYADLYQSLWNALNPEASTPVHQWTDAQVKQIELLLETLPEELRAAFDGYLMSKDEAMIRLVGFSPDAGSAQFSRFQKEIVDHIQPLSIPGVTIRLTGGQVYATSVFENLFGDLLWSIVVAFLFIFVFTAILFRSVLFSLIAVIPNALPILITLALMAVTQMDLKISTIVVFPMALGIAVDACIHLIARWQEESKHLWSAPGPSPEAIRDKLHKTFTTSGKPVLFSILIFLFGLSVLSFSRFGALQELGMLSSITLGAALIVDLALLPVAIFTKAMSVKQRPQPLDTNESSVN